MLQLSKPFGLDSCIVAGTISSFMAWRARRKRNLTSLGATTGAIVGFLLIASTGWRGMTLFGMYQAGSMATKYQQVMKQQWDATAAVSSVRGAGQVLAVSVVAVVLSLWHVFTVGAQRPLQFPNPTVNNNNNNNNDDEILATQISAATLAHHACNLADTLASELGMIEWFGTKSKAASSSAFLANKPRLVTQPWRTVPVGTNGGVTPAGLFWSAVGGAAIGVFHLVMDLLSGHYYPPMWMLHVICFATCAGILGSLADSILGATLQATYYDARTSQVYDSILAARYKEDAIYKAKKEDDDHHRGRDNELQHICGYDLLSNAQVNFVSVILTSYVMGWILAPLMLTWPSTPG